MDSYHYQHKIGHSLLNLPITDFEYATNFKLEYNDLVFDLGETSRDELEIRFEIPHTFLLNVLDIKNLRLMFVRNGIEVDLKEVEGYEEIWDVFNVDTLGLFWSKVSSTSRPIKDEQLLRLVCKRAVKIHNDFAVQGASICALGYRILDRDRGNDPDIGWIENQITTLLEWKHAISPYDDARWSTSVLMLLAYLHLNFGRINEGMKTLRKLLFYRSAIKVAPLIQTNLVRSSMLLADYEMSLGRYDDALFYLEEIPFITMDGVWWSDLSDPVAGAFKYTEFDVVICGAKEALKVISKISEMAEKGLMKTIRLQDLGGYVGVLVRRERLNYGG